MKGFHLDPNLSSSHMTKGYITRWLQILNRVSQF